MAYGLLRSGRIHYGLVRWGSSEFSSHLLDWTPRSVRIRLAALLLLWSRVKEKIRKCVDKINAPGIDIIIVKRGEGITIIREDEMISFEEFAKKYQGERNPTNNQLWNYETVSRATGMDLSVIEEWGKFYLDTFNRISIEQKRYPTDDEIVSAYNAEQASKIIVQYTGTVPGTALHDQLNSQHKDLLIKCTKTELLSAITEIVDKVIAEHLKVTKSS